MFYTDHTMTLWVSNDAFIEIIALRMLPVGIENCIHLGKIASIYMTVWAHSFLSKHSFFQDNFVLFCSIKHTSSRHC